MTSLKKYVPGSDADSEDIFTYPFILEDETVNFLRDHGRIMFIIRGPPGTGKTTLSKMLLEHYPGAVLCSADLYFTDTFVRTRTKEMLKESHNYCAKKVANECKKDVHPIIVQNTHVRKREMQNYLDYAAKFNYTVVIMNSGDKFEITPQLLAKSNTKGLKAEYFSNRLKQWENVPPVFTGWFICPQDCSFLLFQLQSSLEVLLEDGKFCRVFNIFTKDDLLKHYRAKKLLCCVAGYGQKNDPKEIEEYYLSEKVKENYGRCFTVEVQSYLITLSDIFAVVHLKDNMKDLTFIPKSLEFQKNFKNNIESITSELCSMSVGDNISKYSQTVSLSEKFSDSSKTAHTEAYCTNKSGNIGPCSFIHLAENEEKVIFPSKLKKLFDHFCGENAHCYETDDCSEIENGFQVSRLENDGWLIKPSFKILVKSVFTGLYK